MEFVVNGRCRCLSGDPILTCRVCSGREIWSLSKEDDYWLLWTLEHDIMLDQYGMSKDLSAAARNELAAVLATFPLLCSHR